MKKSLKFLSACFVILLFAGCTRDAIVLSPSSDGNTQQTDTTNADTNATTQKDQNGNYNINTIIQTWGAPDNIRDENNSKVYAWTNCKTTGRYINQCDQNNCATIPEKTCCERALITDENGFVTNLKDAISQCL